ncbi:MAG: TIGR04282 family arsenosugar biosynthesis glycosyltransferase [Gemmatimonadetes bacterium]|nr:TIGR04282 family arsenosugar biosynthesis glycosyltransferase [Gemmatimonadota bacterium]
MAASRRKPKGPKDAKRGRPGGGRSGGARSRSGLQPVVAVFARVPQAGRVKTRLTPFLRAREAADLSEALLRDTLDIAEGTGAETVVAFTPLTGRRALERLLGRRRRLIPQGPGDLGDRLARVTGQLLPDRAHPSVLVIGSDCPALSAARLGEANDALAGADVVLGPALDGGYYLVGLKAEHPEIFANIPWSTDRVLEATRQRIEERGLSLALLDPARDLDTPEDLFEWYAGALAENLRERYPRTWRVLHAILPPRRFSDLEAALTENARA